MNMSYENDRQAATKENSIMLAAHSIMIIEIE